jgi:thiosulfate reductase/polysulfide reductase chain A
MSQDQRAAKTGLTRRRFLGTTTWWLAALGLVGSTPYTLRYFDPRGRELEGEESELFTICDNCVNKCGLKARLVGDRLVKLDPNPHFPKSRSMLCARGQAGVQVLYDPDRLKHPLIRTGPRGSGRFRRATWKEALDATAEGLGQIRQKYGPGGVLFASSEGSQEHFFREFSAAFGSPNHVRHPSLCLSSGNTGFFSVFGTVPGFDVANARYLILSGANRLESFITPDTMDLVEVIEKKKARLVYLDPRYTVTASKADLWLPIKPGTDLAFYLALIHVLVAEDLYNRAFVERHTIGFEELAAGVRNTTPEWAERECEVPAAQIREIAREFAYYAPRSFIYQGRRSSWTVNDTPMRQAMAIANALVGSWDTPGGLFPKSSIKLGEMELEVWPEVPEQPCIVDMEAEHPLANAEDGAWIDFRERVLQDKPYPVRGFFVYKQNPMHSLPDRNRTRAMLEKMEFVAVIDIAPSDTAWFADVILPESTYLEREDPVLSFQEPYPFVGLRRPVVRPLHDTRPNFEILKELAGRLGFPEFYAYDLASLQKAQLAPLGLKPEDLAATGVWTNASERAWGRTLAEGHRFPTPSGKIELASERMRRRGYEAVPAYRPPEPLPQGTLRLLVGRHAIFTHAANQNNPWLHELMPENRLWIHPHAAAARGVADGDLVQVQSPAGQVRVKAAVTERIRPDCVYLPHGFDHLSALLTRVHGVGGCDADLIVSRKDRITGNAAMHETAVTVTRSAA